jgi:hypothetical protein
MSPLRGSGVLSFNLSKGGLYLDIALCGLCADMETFAVKKHQGPTAIFNTKAAKGAAKVRKGASKLLHTLAINTFPL